MTKNLGYHLHFGPGKLGLGLVVPSVKELTNPLQTILVARRGDVTLDRRKEVVERYELIRENRSYQVGIEVERERRLSTVNGVDLLYFDTEKGKQELFGYLADPQTQLITTALGAMTSEFVRIFASGLKQRNQTSGKPLFVVACENPPHDSTALKDHLSRELRESGVDVETTLASVFFLNAVVDRVCSQEAEIEEGQVVIPGVERFHQWVVLCPEEFAASRSEVEQVFGPSIEMVWSKIEFDFLEKRKTWLVNGTHVALAFYAWGREIHSLQEAIEDDHTASLIRAAQKGFGQALFAYGQELGLHIPFSSPDAIRSFAAEVLDRIMTGPEDSHDRILSGWIRWAGQAPGLHPLLQKSVLRSIEPIEKIVKADIPISSPEVLRAFVELLVHKIRLLEVRCDTLLKHDRS